MANDSLRRAGDLVNQFFGDISTATAPGAGKDLLGFIQNELTKYPGTTAADPQAPAFDVANNVLRNILSMTGLEDPVSQAGGPSQAILGPIGRATAKAVGPGGAKKFNQAQKKILKSIFRADPETLKEVQASKRMMHVGVPGAVGGGVPKLQKQELIDQVMEGAFAHYQPGTLGGTVRVDPRVLRGKDPRGGLMKQYGVEGLPDIATHEATHFLNDPGFLETLLAQGLPRADTSRLALALEPFIGQAKYGSGIVRKNVGKGKPEMALNEALSYLAQPTGRSPAATWLHNALTGRAREGGIGQFERGTRDLLQEALDAATRVPQVKRPGLQPAVEPAGGFFERLKGLLR